LGVEAENAPCPKVKGRLLASTGQAPGCHHRKNGQRLAWLGVCRSKPNEVEMNRSIPKIKDILEAATDKLLFSLLMVENQGLRPSSTS
jgi:hypothetical protein